MLPTTQLCQHIETLWRAHRLGPLGRVEPVALGRRNPCFFVDSDLVVRLNTLDPHFAKFRNEAAAYRLLVGSEIPTPTVILLDDSRHYIPYDALVTSRLAGLDLATSGPGLPAAEQQALARAAGRCLARLHEYRFEGFGKLRTLPELPFASWPDYYFDYALRYLRPAVEHQLIGSAAQEQLEGILLQAEPLLRRVSQGVLVHSDFHYENILQANGQLSGVLDFEWAFVGDPSCDFTSAPVREEMLPGSTPYFQEGYLSMRRLDAEHEQRLRLYHLVLMLETAVMEHAQQNWQALRLALDRLSIELLTWQPGG